MGKRSDFKRLARDLYKTPRATVKPLLRHLPKESRFYEPCAGDGSLVCWLMEAGHRCNYAADIRPQRPWRKAVHRIYKRDIFKHRLPIGPPITRWILITNPPWAWEVLKPILDKIIAEDATAWLLLPADFMQNVRSAPYMKRCKKVLAIGRVKWIADSKHSGLDNACWYLFLPRRCATRFYGRIESGKNN